MIALQHEPSLRHRHCQTIPIRQPRESGSIWWRARSQWVRLKKIGGLKRIEAALFTVQKCSGKSSRKEIHRCRLAHSKMSSFKHFIEVVNPLIFDFWHCPGIIWQRWGGSGKKVYTLYVWWRCDATRRWRAGRRDATRRAVWATDAVSGEWGVGDFISGLEVYLELLLHQHQACRLGSNVARSGGN